MRPAEPRRREPRGGSLTGAELRVRLHPRAAREEIAGERDGAVLARVTEPPLEGRANAALVKLIAKRAGIAKGRVRIVRGARSRDKLVRVEGMGEAELRRALGLGEGSSR